MDMWLRNSNGRSEIEKSLLELNKIEGGWGEEKVLKFTTLRHSFVNSSLKATGTSREEFRDRDVNKESVNILFEPLEILTWVPHQMSDKLRNNLENKREIFFKDNNIALNFQWFFLNWLLTSTWLSALDRSLATCFQVFKFSHQSCLFKNEFRRIYHRHFTSWNLIENATLLYPSQSVLFECDFRV